MSVLLSPEEVAERLRLSRRTVIVWLQQGRLPGLKVGNRWRVRADDLALILQQGADSLLSPAPTVPGPVTPVRERPARKARRKPAPSREQGAAGPQQEALAFDPVHRHPELPAPAPTGPDPEPGQGTKPEPVRADPAVPGDPDDPILNVIGCISAPPIPPEEINKLVYRKESR